MKCTQQIALGLMLTFACCCGGRPAIAIDALTITIACGACHGPSTAVGAAAIPSLNGASRDEIRAALMAYKAGTRTGVIMPRLVKAWTDSEIEQIATSIAKAAPGR